MKTAQLIDAARLAARVESDYRLSKLLGVGTQTVSQWRSGATYPSALHVFRLADMAGLNPGPILAQLEQERAQRAGKLDQVTAWRDLLEKLGGAAAMVILSAGLSISGDSSAGQTNIDRGLNNPGMYIMSTILRLAQLVRRHLSGGCAPGRRTDTRGANLGVYARSLAPC